MNSINIYWVTSKVCDTSLCTTDVASNGFLPSRGSRQGCVQVILRTHHLKSTRLHMGSWRKFSVNVGKKHILYFYKLYVLKALLFFFFFYKKKENSHFPNFGMYLTTLNIFLSKRLQGKHSQQNFWGSHFLTWALASHLLIVGVVFSLPVPPHLHWPGHSRKPPGSHSPWRLTARWRHSCCGFGALPWLWLGARESWFSENVLVPFLNNFSARMQGSTVSNNVHLRGIFFCKIGNFVGRDNIFI